MPEEGQRIDGDALKLDQRLRDRCGDVAVRVLPDATLSSWQACGPDGDVVAKRLAPLAKARGACTSVRPTHQPHPRIRRVAPSHDCVCHH